MSITYFHYPFYVPHLNRRYLLTVESEYPITLGMIRVRSSGAFNGGGGRKANTAPFDKFFVKSFQKT